MALLNELCCGSPHTHAFSFTNNSLIGWVISARFGENLLSWLTMPRKLRTSLTAGVANRTIAETLFGSADFISRWTPGFIMGWGLATPVAPVLFVACSSIRACTWVVFTTPCTPAPRLVDGTHRSIGFTA